MNWFREGFAEIVSQFAAVLSSDKVNYSNSGQAQGTSSSGHQSSNSGQTQGTSSGSYHSGGEASYGRSAWSEPFQFDPNTNNVNQIRTWGCQGKAGIYLIRDESDEHTLYVGKAEGTSRDILARLQAHLTGNGNSGIGERIDRGETLTIRWVECDNPEKYESVAMAYLLPYDNERCEFQGIETIGIDEEIGIGIALDLPSFWHSNYQDMVEEIKELDLYIAAYGSNRVEIAEAIFIRCNEEINELDNDDNRPLAKIFYDTIKNFGVFKMAVQIISQSQKILWHWETR